MINIPAGDLFDLLKEGKSSFYDRDKCQNYNIEIGEENKDITPEDEYYRNTIIVTKAGIIELLMNRVFICDEFELKISL